jgi:hypothetical protein
MLQAARGAARLARRAARPLHASSVVRADTPVCGSGACSTPRACASDASSANRDIAFKPAASGWGYSKARGARVACTAQRTAAVPRRSVQLPWTLRARDTRRPSDLLTWCACAGGCCELGPHLR